MWNRKKILRAFKEPRSRQSIESWQNSVSKECSTLAIEDVEK